MEEVPLRNAPSFESGRIVSAEPNRQLKVYGKREITFLAMAESGREIDISVDFFVIDVHRPILSVGKLQQAH
eukprot:1855831-Alexandrium_andersonii.AAC.1